VYVAEIASSKLRGALGGFHQTSITTGILLSYVFGVLFSWRDITVPGIAMPVLLVIVMMFMTETPRWYLQHNKRSSALNALLWLRGKTADIDSECYETEQSIGKLDIIVVLNLIVGIHVHVPWLAEVSKKETSARLCVFFCQACAS